jgi:uroporphyrinogen decarboxylase
MCATGIDAMKISSPFAGAGFLSRKFYSRFVLPYERRLARKIRDRGVHVYTHTCGAIGDRLDLLLEAGVSGIECLDPPPLGNVELSEAKRVMQGRAFIKGNVDSVNVLLHGTHDDVVRDVSERLRIGKEGGGFILSTACSVAPGVPPERLVLLRNLAEQFGVC